MSRKRKLTNAEIIHLADNLSEIDSDISDFDADDNLDDPQYELPTTHSIVDDYLSSESDAEEVPEPEQESNTEQEKETATRIIWSSVGNDFVPRKPIPKRKTPIIHGNIDHSSTEFDVFLKMFPRSLFIHIAACTNQRLEILEKKKKIKLDKTDPYEIMTVVGCLLIMSFNSLPSQQMYWSQRQSLGNQTIKNAIGRDRFMLLASKMYFNEPEKPDDADKTYYVNELLACFKSTFQRTRTDSTYQSIDESMVRFKGRSVLKQYLPLKPIKRGVKLWQRCDSETGYVYDVNVYSGKETNPAVVGTLGERVIQTLCSTIKDKDVVICCDRFFTSVNLVDTLDFALVGTCMKNRRNVPVFNEKKTKRGDSTIKCNKYGSIAAKWHDTKDVIVLSNCHTDAISEVKRTAKDGTRNVVPCPEAIAFYNEYMGGVDLSDQFAALYDPNRKSTKWWKKVFQKLLMVSVANSWILYQELKHNKCKMIDFLVPLAEQLVGYGKQHAGYLGNSRVVLNNHFDAATQADIQHMALSYESEDETMGKFQARSRRGTALYSKQDILEQYCISERGMGALETDRRSFFSCLSSHQLSPCTRSSILTVCVRQKIPSDENLQDLYKRPQYAPYPRKPRWGPPPPEIYHYDEDLNSSYFRRKAHTDASTYQWMPSDDESVRMERPRSILDHHSHQAGLPHTSHRTKHVSFARSHTLTSFDDAVVSLGASTSNLTKTARSQERLIDTRRSLDRIIPITKQPEFAENILIMEKLIRTPMKTQATQTEACLGRKPVPASQINLSPRTVHRVKMVSQGAQTNGIIINGRKLTKSYSEAGSKFGPAPPPDPTTPEAPVDHEPVQRTLSDEPPRSPFILTSPPPDLLPPQSDSSSVTRSEHDSEESESKKEIFIDFKPQIPQLAKKVLMKTASDGEMLIDQRSLTVECPLTSVSHENIVAADDDPSKYLPYFKTTPIRHEGIFKDLEDHVFSSIDESCEGNGLYPQDSIDEVFHENYIYDGKYIKVEGSSTSEDQERDGKKSDETQEEDECVVPSFYIRSEDKSSPFASSDSLANDIRDHSDGIWNESQATVLQADSGTENGAAISTSEIASLSAASAAAVTSPVSVKLLTPSSRRKYLLMMQHQQRSSIDTEALDEELVDQLQIPSPSSPRTLETPSISVKGPEPTSSKHYLQLRKKTISPTYRRRTPEPPAESPQPAVVPDLLLARTDSGKTNTDISESTTTTDDYITANSTDSSRRSTSIRGSDRARSHQVGPEGSSFESGSSIYSLTKADFLGDDMVVPSFSPPPILEETIEITSTPVPEVRTGRSSPTGSSSSSGSYSLNGSCPELPQRPPVPSPKNVPSVSEDDRSAHYSSSGYYDSPLEDDATWKSSKSDRKDWMEEEKTPKQPKPFTLDVAKQHQEELSSSTDKSRSSQSKPAKLSPPKELLKPVEKSKQRRIRTRSPMQVHRKIQQQKKSPMLKSPEKHDVEFPEDRKPLTSDDSINNEQFSPRKSKKPREKGRKSPRSPTGMKGRKRSGSIDDKPVSLPGSLARKKTIQRGVAQDDTQSLHSSKSRIGPHSHSPEASPTKQKPCPDTSRLKAVSAESLRSVSPGSDSVFYSDPSSHVATSDQHVHCLHCGKEVDIVTTDDLGKSSSQPDIVQPPAGFADSPRSKHPTGGRLFKKFEKRYRSEDRPIDRRHHRYRSDGTRAKSEERAAKADNGKSKLRPMARSRDTSLEGLRATDSSPSVLPAAPDDEDDLGMYNCAYIESSWIYIDDHEEMQTWSRPASADEEIHIRESVTSTDSTESEHDFKKRFQAVTHRMVHRKSCLEMYKRQASKSFAPESTTGEHESIRTSLEELLKLMLVVWCRENQALKVICTEQNESDKTVVVRRESGEFGFRIHGSKPVVVSAIEPDTPAESSGLEVGDIVLAVNGVSVLDKSHSEVVKIAHAGSDTLTLEVARTCGVLSPPSAEVHGGSPLYSGYLWKLGGHASGTPSNKWIRRWFSLKKDNCLYFYKTDMDKQPVGAMMLFNYDISRVEDGEAEATPRSFRFSLRRRGVPSLHLAADTDQAVARWLEVLIQAAEESQLSDAWLEQTRRNLTVPPNAIRKPDCFGYLVKLGNQWKSWSRRYCVLKDACLYFYQDANAKSAFGVACLHGYRVQQSSAGSKKHAFEIIPSDPNQKHFYFHAESDMDRKRWLAALEYSIDRWLKVG